MYSSRAFMAAALSAVRERCAMTMPLLGATDARIPATSIAIAILIVRSPGFGCILARLHGNDEKHGKYGIGRRDGGATKNERSPVSAHGRAAHATGTKKITGRSAYRAPAGLLRVGLRSPEWIIWPARDRACAARPCRWRRVRP